MNPPLNPSQRGSQRSSAHAEFPSSEGSGVGQSSSSHLGFDKTLNLLDRLKSVVENCTTRADQLDQELRQNTSRLDWQFDQEVKDLELRLSQAGAEADGSFQTGKEQLESRHDQRKARMLRAQTAARKQHLKRIESREGRQINEVQRELLLTSRNHE